MDWWWTSCWDVNGLRRLFGTALLADERFMDVGNDATSGDGSLDQAVEFLVSANGELKMARGDTLDFQVLRSVAGQLENLKIQARCQRLI